MAPAGGPNGSTLRVPKNPVRPGQYRLIIDASPPMPSPNPSPRGDGDLRSAWSWISTTPDVKYLIRDRDGKYPSMVDQVLADAGITVVLSGVRVPRMNSVMER